MPSGAHKQWSGGAFEESGSDSGSGSKAGALAEEGWRKPSTPWVEDALEELKMDSNLADLGTKLSRQQELKGNEVANMLLRVLSKQQSDHERRMEALILRSLGNDGNNRSLILDASRKKTITAPKPFAASEPQTSPMFLPHQPPDGEVESSAAHALGTSLPRMAEDDTSHLSGLSYDDATWAGRLSGQSACTTATGVESNPMMAVASVLNDNLETLQKMRDSETGVTQVHRISEHVQAMKDHTDQMRQTVDGGLLTGDLANIEVNIFRETALRLAGSRNFEMAICIAILLNSILIGIESDAAMRRPLESASTWFLYSNAFFICLFSVEICLRLVAEGCVFFNRLNPKFYWNFFDLTLVVLALLEELLGFVLASSPDMSAARILRTMRIVRGFRIIRVFKFFRYLRIMVSGIMHSMQSLVWAILLLMSMMYLFSVCFLQFAADEHLAHLKDLPTKGLDTAQFSTLMLYYGDLPTCIYTLYCSIVGGLDWGEAAEPLMKLNITLGLLFCCYIAFAVLCVLNIITGVFVENANRIVSQDADMVMMEQVEERQQWFSEVKDLFEAADTNGSGYLNADEFRHQMQDLRMQAWLRKIGVHVEAYSANGLFKLLDFDGDGKLGIDEFALALQQVHGNARSIDVARIGMESKALRKELRDHSILCITMFKDMFALFNQNMPTQGATTKGTIHR